MGFNSGFKELMVTMKTAKQHKSIFLVEVVTKPTNACKHLTVYYVHSMPSTCFGHSCGHPQGGAL